MSNPSAFLGAVAVSVLALACAPGRNVGEAEAEGDPALAFVGARIVDGRHMPDVNLQYCMAAIVLDGGKLTFEATHT